MNRRDFLKRVGAAIGGLVVGVNSIEAAIPKKKKLINGRSCDYVIFDEFAITNPVLVMEEHVAVKFDSSPGAIHEVPVLERGSEAYYKSLGHEWDRVLKEAYPSALKKVK